MTNILFFDGICVMCNGLVEFVLKHDKAHRFKFAPLQGATAKELIPEYSERLDTIVLLDEAGIHTESDAILCIFTKLGGIFALIPIFKIVPKTWRDRAYRWVSRNRYRLFGQHEHCRLLSPSERSRMLD